MKIAENAIVTIDYKLTDADGDILEVSEGDENFAYLHGHGQLPDKLEKELEGKEAGANVKVSMSPEEGFGERDDDQVISVPRDRFPEDEELQEGLQVQAETEEGHQIFSVVQFDDKTVTLDGNHPYAGIDLTFEVTVREVREATAEELDHGHAHGDGHHHH